jgi:hypothetical protein
MKQFYTGFILGCFLRNKVIRFGIICITKGIKTYYHLKKNKNIQNYESNKILNVCILIKIKNKEYFQDLFTDFQKNKCYFCEKGVFKLKLSNEMTEYLNRNFNTLNVSTVDLCELSYTETYGYTTLSKVGDIYTYINYQHENKKYINVYKDNDSITTESFELNIDRKYINLICATVQYNSKIAYITKYFKLFLNNKNLTVEMLLLNYDNLNINLLNTELLLINNNCNQKYLISDKII